jgi:hypothetical protein
MAGDFPFTEGKNLKRRDEDIPRLTKAVKGIREKTLQVIKLS